ncbi:uncharacterized protein LOC101860867 [Aplysia californica]|uniref:Uncharacterized protein LOC101860867 n=1 Tax=Aplysia californica TaxID=6500 RepID=A0ABM1A4K8_APLCA|nr:uncharacterized protein LOC101860867 [Aplysia californica]
MMSKWLIQFATFIALTLCAYAAVVNQVTPPPLPKSCSRDVKVITCKDRGNLNAEDVAQAVLFDDGVDVLIIRPVSGQCHCGIMSVARKLKDADTLVASSARCDLKDVKNCGFNISLKNPILVGGLFLSKNESGLNWVIKHHMLTTWYEMEDIDCNKTRMTLYQGLLKDLHRAEKDSLEQKKKFKPRATSSGHRSWVGKNGHRDLSRARSVPDQQSEKESSTSASPNLDREQNDLSSLSELELQETLKAELRSFKFNKQSVHKRSAQSKTVVNIQEKFENGLHRKKDGAGFWHLNKLRKRTWECFGLPKSLNTEQYNKEQIDSFVCQHEKHLFQTGPSEEWLTYDKQGIPPTPWALSSNHSRGVLKTDKSRQKVIAPNVKKSQRQSFIEDLDYPNTLRGRHERDNDQSEDGINAHEYKRATTSKASRSPEDKTVRSYHIRTKNPSLTNSADRPLMCNTLTCLRKRHDLRRRSATPKATPLFVVPHRVYVAGEFYSLFEGWRLLAALQRDRAMRELADTVHRSADVHRPSARDNLPVLEPVLSLPPGLVALMGKDVGFRESRGKTDISSLETESVNVATDHVTDTYNYTGPVSTTASVPVAAATHAKSKPSVSDRAAFDHRIKSFVVFVVAIIGIISVVAALLILAVKEKRLQMGFLPYPESPRRDPEQSRRRRELLLEHERLQDERRTIYPDYPGVETKKEPEWPPINNVTQPTTPRKRHEASSFFKRHPKSIQTPVEADFRTVPKHPATGDEFTSEGLVEEQEPLPTKTPFLGGKHILVDFGETDEASAIGKPATGKHDVDHDKKQKSSLLIPETTVPTAKDKNTNMTTVGWNTKNAFVVLSDSSRICGPTKFHRNIEQMEAPVTDAHPRIEEQIRGLELHNINQNQETFNDTYHRSRYDGGPAMCKAKGVCPDTSGELSRGCQLRLNSKLYGRLISCNGNRETSPFLRGQTSPTRHGTHKTFCNVGNAVDPLRKNRDMPTTELRHFVTSFGPTALNKETEQDLTHIEKNGTKTSESVLERHDSAMSPPEFKILSTEQEHNNTRLWKHNFKVEHSQKPGGCDVRKKNMGKNEVLGPQRSDAVTGCGRSEGSSHLVSFLDSITHEKHGIMRYNHRDLRFQSKEHDSELGTAFSLSPSKYLENLSRRVPVHKTCLPLEHSSINNNNNNNTGGRNNTSTRGSRNPSTLCRGRTTGRRGRVFCVKSFSNKRRGRWMAKHANRKNGAPAERAQGFDMVGPWNLHCCYQHKTRRKAVSLIYKTFNRKTDGMCSNYTRVVGETTWSEGLIGFSKMCGRKSASSVWRSHLSNNFYCYKSGENIQPKQTMLTMGEPPLVPLDANNNGGTLVRESTNGNSQRQETERRSEMLVQYPDDITSSRGVSNFAPGEVINVSGSRVDKVYPVTASAVLSLGKAYPLNEWRSQACSDTEEENEGLYRTAIPPQDHNCNFMNFRKEKDEERKKKKERKDNEDMQKKKGMKKKEDMKKRDIDARDEARKKKKEQKDMEKNRENAKQPAELPSTSGSPPDQSKTHRPRSDSLILMTLKKRTPKIKKKTNLVKKSAPEDKGISDGFHGFLKHFEPHHETVSSAPDSRRNFPQAVFLDPPTPSSPLATTEEEEPRRVVVEKPAILTSRRYLRPLELYKGGDPHENAGISTSRSKKAELFSINISQAMKNSLGMEPKGDTGDTYQQRQPPVTFDDVMSQAQPPEMAPPLIPEPTKLTMNEGVVWPSTFATAPPYTSPGYDSHGVQQPVGVVRVLNASLIPASPSEGVVGHLKVPMPTWVSPLYRSYGVGGPYGPHGPFYPKTEEYWKCVETVPKQTTKSVRTMWFPFIAIQRWKTKQQENRPNGIEDRNRRAKSGKANGEQGKIPLLIFGRSNRSQEKDKSDKTTVSSSHSDNEPYGNMLEDAHAVTGRKKKVSFQLLEPPMKTETSTAQDQRQATSLQDTGALADTPAVPKITFGDEQANLAHTPTENEEVEPSSYVTGEDEIPNYSSGEYNTTSSKPEDPTLNLDTFQDQETLNQDGTINIPEH